MEEDDMPFVSPLGVDWESATSPETIAQRRIAHSLSLISLSQPNPVRYTRLVNSLAPAWLEECFQ